MIVFSRVNENKFTVPAGFDKVLLIGGDGLGVKLFLTNKCFGVAIHFHDASLQFE